MDRYFAVTAIATEAITITYESCGVWSGGLGAIFSIVSRITTRMKCVFALGMFCREKTKFKFRIYVRHEAVIPDARIALKCET